MNTKTMQESINVSKDYAVILSSNVIRLKRSKILFPKFRCSFQEFKGSILQASILKVPSRQVLYAVLNLCHPFEQRNLVIIKELSKWVILHTQQQVEPS